MADGRDKGFIYIAPIDRAMLHIHFLPNTYCPAERGRLLELVASRSIALARALPRNIDLFHHDSKLPHPHDAMLGLLGLNPFPHTLDGLSK